MPNRLVNEKSPYLLQHAHNPVDWYPWGSDALGTARQENKPILVSIGYSACHWCHVMERESFEDETTAAVMNRDFINIKVDREERPDVDAVYMEAVQALSGQGGWPLNVFLTPDGRPFFGGTYFPPGPGHGMPSWLQVLESVAETYRHRPDDVLHNASLLTDYVRRAQSLQLSDEPLSPALIQDAYHSMMTHCDEVDGGFGGAPKFPQPLALEFVLRMAIRDGHPDAMNMLHLTLRKMAEGGIYDHLGGGFHRYTVDRAWIVPHFEKMLYDNALLARVYLQAFRATGNPLYQRVTEQTLDYLLRDMRAPEGGLFSAQDADSEGVEGKYYVWTPEEIDEVLDPEAKAVIKIRYGISSGGNFEGQTILTVAASLSDVASQTGLSLDRVQEILEPSREILLRVRAQRIPPATDTKILVSWNALAIRVLAEAGRVLRRPEYLEAATRGANFVLSAMRPEGRLVRSYREGPSDIDAFLEDYAYLVEALLSLYEYEFSPHWLTLARELVEEMIDRFWDESESGFFDVARQSDSLVVRPRSLFDNPIPSGGSSATFALLRLQALSGDDHAAEIVPAFRRSAPLLARAPLGFSYLLCALDFYLSPQTQLAMVGDISAPDTQALIDVALERYHPNVVMAAGPPDSSPLLENRDMVEGRATAFVCEHFTCRLPTTDPGALRAQLENA